MKVDDQALSFIVGGKLPNVRSVFGVDLFPLGEFPQTSEDEVSKDQFQI